MINKLANRIARAAKINEEGCIGLEIAFESQDDFAPRLVFMVLADGELVARRVEFVGDAEVEPILRAALTEVNAND